MQRFGDDDEGLLPDDDILRNIVTVVDCVGGGGDGLGVGVGVGVGVGEVEDVVVDVDPSVFCV